MLFITGDVHHQSLKTGDQSYLDITEVEAAQKYAQIAKEYNIKITLFISGKAVDENPEVVSELGEMHNVELGGHNWNCFENQTLHYMSEILLDSYYGPKIYQKWDIKKTLNRISAVCDCTPNVWRSHGYVQDPRTPTLLSNEGIDVVSNSVNVSDAATVEEAADGIISLPINVLPDHSHVYHGWIDSEIIDRQRFLMTTQLRNLIYYIRELGKFETKWLVKRGVNSVNQSTRRSLFEREWYTPEEWLERIKTQIRLRNSKSGFASVLIHPSCMEIMDSMETFRKICRFVSNYQTFFVSQVQLSN
jgi:hypothetical protein